MPFKEFKAVETVQKKRESKTFNSSYIEVKSKYIKIQYVKRLSAK